MKKINLRFVVMLVALLAFGIVLVACDNGSGSGGTVTPGGATVQTKSYDVDGVTFKMVEIKDVTDKEIGDDTKNNNKKHKVTLTNYSIGETEVTQELWQKVMGSNPSGFKDNPAEGETQAKRPVEKVSWYDCVAFCNELTKKVTSLGESECVYYSDSEKTKVYTKDDADKKTTPVMDMSKKGFRLPTEAEWEYAAMGGTTNKYAGTDTESELTNYAWYTVNSDSKTHEVAKKTKNGYGLYDMSGNVWEWCWDWYSSSTPTGGADPAGASGGSGRVRRGGGWGNGAVYCERAYRFINNPGGANGSLGLRLGLRP